MTVLGRGTRLATRDLDAALELLNDGPITRGELIDRLDLSTAAATRAVRSLVKAGLVTESVAARPTVGRPRQLLTPIPAARHLVGIKLTGDRCYGVATNLAAEVLYQDQLPLPSPEPGGATPVPAAASVIVAVVSRLCEHLPSLDGVAVSLGGRVIDGTITYAPFLGWHDTDLRPLLHSRLGVPVTVVNDVVGLTQQLMWFGPTRSQRSFGVITVGAGLGFGFAHHGQLTEQLFDDGYLLAHMPIGASTALCNAGHTGCASSVLGLPETLAAARRRLRRAVTVDQLPQLMAPGGPLADLADQRGKALGELAATIAGVLQSSLIVIAGEGVDIIEHHRDAIHQAIADRIRGAHRHAPGIGITVDIRHLDFDAWAQGAAAVAIRQSLAGGSSPE